MDRKFFKDIEQKQELFSIKCSSERSSKRYQDAVKYLASIIWKSYVPTLQIISIFTTRGKEIYDQFLSIRMIDSFLESSVSIIYLVEEGFINQCKRELRFHLEAVLKFWYLDQEMMGHSFDAKMKRYNEILPNSSLEFLDRIKIGGLSPENDFKGVANSLYRDLCKYVHASEYQSLERLGKSERGEYLGYTSAEEVEDLCKLAFRTLDIALACHLSACGPSTTGDLFIHVLDKQADWKFHKGYFVQQISKSFDYKLERQNKRT